MLRAFSPSNDGNDLATFNPDILLIMEITFRKNDEQTYVIQLLKSDLVNNLLTILIGSTNHLYLFFFESKRNCKKRN